MTKTLADGIPIERVRVGEKGGERLRTDKRVKRYLSEKRPRPSDHQRLYCYRTSTCLACHKARRNAVEPDLMGFLEREHAWAVSQLMRFDPVALVTLGYSVPPSRLQLTLDLAIQPKQSGTPSNERALGRTRRRKRSRGRGKVRAR